LYHFPPFTAESDGKSIMEEWDEKGSLGITLVNAVGITACLSKLIASKQGSLSAQT